MIDPKVISVVFTGSLIGGIGVLLLELGMGTGVFTSLGLSALCFVTPWAYLFMTARR